MARGDERHLKHRRDVGAYSSGPSAKPKKLAKRPQPNSYQEIECLKMYSSEIHTISEIVNYSKEDPKNVVHLRNKPCYNLVKERGTDERF
jgi:hypothetical protein